MRKFFKNKLFLIGLGTSFSSILGVLLFVSVTRDVPFLELLYILYHLPFYGSIDNFWPGMVIDININYFFYIIIVISIWLSLLFLKVFSRDQSVAEVKKVISVAALSSFVVLISMQSSANLQFWLWRVSFYGGVPLEERINRVHPDIYVFAEGCKKILSGNYTAKLVTDMDMSQDPGLYYHRVLAYFLYPIDIRGVRKEPQDCLVVFDKENPKDAVPPNYRIVLISGQRSLLAVKKGADNSL